MLSFMVEDKFMNYYKSTAAPWQSQRVSEGFLLLEVLIACVILAGVGILFQQQMSNIFCRAVAIDEQLHVMRYMINRIERMHMFNGVLGNTTDEYDKKGIRYHCVAAPVLLPVEGLIPGCRLIKMQGEWKKRNDNGHREKMTITTVVLCGKDEP